jgi:hypothetical protein
MAYVYILRNGNENLFKIGKSDNVEDRMRSLATGNPRLSVFDTIETEDDDEWEGYLHKRLRSKRSRGSSAQEFFEITPDALNVILTEAREFLPKFLETREAAEILREEKSIDRIVTPSSEDAAIYERLLQAREQEDRWHYERLHLENRLKLAIGTAAGLEGMISWKTRTKQKFDQTSFRTAHPTLYEQYSVTIYERAFVPRVSWAVPNRDEAEEEGNQ